MSCLFFFAHFAIWCQLPILRQSQCMHTSSICVQESLSGAYSGQNHQEHHHKKKVWPNRTRLKEWSQGKTPHKAPPMSALWELEQCQRPWRWISDPGEELHKINSLILIGQILCLNKLEQWSIFFRGHHRVRWVFNGFGAPRSLPLTGAFNRHVHMIEYGRAIDNNE